MSEVPHRRRSERIRYLALVASGLVLLFLTRLPELRSEDVRLDGDEAILGLMALHLKAGTEVPIVFWGQTYGLSIVECGVVALAFAFAGVSDLAVRVSMLVLFGVGWVFFAACAAHLAGGPFRWASLLLVLCPAFAGWSMAARGGYTTAFVLTGLLVWLALSRLRTGSPATIWAVAGLVWGVTLQAQPLFGLAALAYLSFVLAGHLRLWRGIAWCGGAAAGWLGIRLLASGERAFWTPAAIGGFDPGAVALLPDRLRVLFTGSFLYDRASEAGAVTSVAALSWCAAIVISIVLAFSPASGGRRRVALGAIAAIVAVAAYSTVAPVFHYRYLLPIGLFGSLLVLVTAGAPVRRVPRGIAALALACLAAISAAACLESGRHSRFVLAGGSGGWPANDVPLLARDLEENGFLHVYTLHPMLQWGIMFYSEERVLARWINADSRRPRYPRAVDDAFHSGEPVAIAGPTGMLDRLASEAIPGAPLSPPRRVGAGLGWVGGASEPLLRRIGFDLNPIRTGANPPR